MVVVLIVLLWREEGSVSGCVVFVGSLVFWWRRDFCVCERRIKGTRGVGSQEIEKRKFVLVADFRPEGFRGCVHAVFDSSDFCLWVLEQTQFSGVKKERRARRRRRFSGGFSGVGRSVGFFCV